MDLETYEEMVISISNEIDEKEKSYSVKYSAGKGQYNNSIEIAKIANLIDLGLTSLPDHLIFLKSAWQNWKASGQYFVETKALLNYILELIHYQKDAIAKSEEKNKNLFASAERKMNEASYSFINQDFTSALNNLNTALELILKEIFEIPTTITSINTARIINICSANNVDLCAYFKEIKKHVTQIDNKIKHKGYTPSKADCINALKIMEEFASKLKNRKLVLNEDLRNKIYEEI